MINQTLKQTGASPVTCCIECGRNPEEFPVVYRSRCAHCWKVYRESAGLSRTEREAVYSREMQYRRTFSNLNAGRLR